jgi:4-amino-4-deoxy-L-arabinose transferase-like glycosyltransferase
MSSVLPRAERRERDVVLAAIAILAWLLLTIAWRPLMLPDEGRYGGVAWEMLRSGDWLTPRLDGLPFFHKPPLFYWITAASMAVFGPHPWAARAASLLGAVALGCALYLFVRRWGGRPAARAALLVLATLPMFFLGAQFANLDMLVAGCIGCTVLLGAHTMLAAEDGRAHGRAATATWAVAGIGVLAKGLIGFVLPGAILLAWALAMRRPRRALALLTCGPGMLAFLAIVLPWHLAMQARHPGFLHYYIVVQHWQRFGQGGFNNVQPFWFYPVVLIALGLPWVAWLPALRRREFWADPVRGDLRVLMATWFAVVVVFFSMPASKLIGYVLPALPPMAVLIAEAAGSTASQFAPRWRGVAAAAALLCLVAVGTLAWWPRGDGRPIAAALRSQAGAGEPVIFAGHYFYDVPVLARLTGAVPVAEDWSDPTIMQRDNWRRELADAATFAHPDEAARLIPLDRLGSTLCAATVTWVVATGRVEKMLPVLSSQTPLVRSGDAGLWRITRADPATDRALDCRGTPSGAPASR